MLTKALRQLAVEHVEHLAERHGVRLRWTRTMYTSEVDYMIRTAFVPKELKYGADYLVTLHEIGHLVARGARGDEYDERPGHLVKVEAAAWSWALNNALPGLLEALTIKDRRTIGLCWASYIGPTWLAEDSR